ncbi:RNI-like protein [Trametes cingulata]|nr:RNI-like protein [Trametes cingulata]
MITNNAETGAPPGNTGAPTEQTPLLLPDEPLPEYVEREQSQADALPYISTYAADVAREDLISYDIRKLYPPSISSSAARSAFALCVLLSYRNALFEKKAYERRDAWHEWRAEDMQSAEIRNSDAVISKVWLHYLKDEGAAKDIRVLLWSAFPLRPHSERVVRVIDFLAGKDAPEDILCHRLVDLSLLETWKYGRQVPQGDGSILTTLLHPIDACHSPSAVYLIDLLAYLIYLGVLCCCIVDVDPLVRFGRVYVSMYAALKLFRPWTISTVPAIVVLISLVLYELAEPGEYLGVPSFEVTLYALILEIALLHVPSNPNSPLFLFSPDTGLPLAVFARRGLGKLLIPVLSCLAGFLVSAAPSEESIEVYHPWPFHSLLRYHTYDPWPFNSPAIVLAFFCTLFFCQYSLWAYSTTVRPCLNSHSEPHAKSWDRYTKPVDLEARRAFACQPSLLRTAMSSRRRQGQRTAQPPAKRRKVEHSQPDDDIPTPQSQANAPSAAALSERVLPPETIPSLSTICIRVFAENLQKLSRKATVWEDVRLWLKELPDPLAQKVFATLKRTCPTLLQHGFIVSRCASQYFLRGTSIYLNDDLPGVTRLTIFAIGDMPNKDQIRALELTGFAKVADTAFATVVAKLPALRKLNLRGCTKAGQKTVEAVAKHCPHLEVLNLNYTAAPPVSLAPLLLNCKQLRVLKVAGIPNWLWDALGITDGFQLLNLRSLKLRQTALSDAVLNPALAICPGLERLDLSFTLVKRPILPTGHMVEKLVLTSTKITSNDLLAMLTPLRKLKVLAIGAMGGGQGSSAAISNTSAMTLTDETLHSLTALLEQCPDIERVNLVGNTKLGFTGRRGPDAALARFVRKVGRRCKHLNLANITSLRSSDLEGLADPEGADEGPPQLVHLNLNNTSVDDTAAPYISACVHLQTLELASTKFTSAGLFPIIDACERLEKLDLTSCRGVRVSDRRRFFEVWEEEWKNA